VRRLAAVAILLVAASAAPCAADTPEEIFERGSKAYEAGRYDEAAEAYRTVLRYGIRDPRVEYNLGNAAFKLHRLGEAILHYERAYRLDPSDRDIRGNLELARSRRFDRVEEAEAPALVAWIRSAQNSLGPDRQAIAAVALVWILVAIAVRGLARPGGFTPAAGWAAATVAALLVVVALSWRATNERLEGGNRAVVLASAVEVLSGPSANNPVLFTIHEGSTLDVRAEREEWIQVSLPNGLNGWVPRDAVGIV
jgi:tetratricopeptide (TPR) repeat protein